MASTRTPEQVARVLALRAEGLATSGIARLTAIPTSTVHRWCRAAPQYASPSVPGPRACWRCTGSAPSAPWRRQYSYLPGQYLGDGWIDRGRRGVQKLCICGDAKYVGITSETVEAMHVVSGNTVNVRLRMGCNIVYAYSSHWHCLFPQFGPGLKSERPIVLEPWQQRIARQYPRQLIRGLIHSDGCRVVNTVRGASGKRYSYVRYHFSNNSLDIQGILTGALDQLGIPWRNNRWNSVSIARREGVAALDEFVGPKS